MDKTVLHKEVCANG